VDIAAAYKPTRHSQYIDPDVFETDVTRAFPEFNCGVILYRDNERVQEFMDEWERRYREFLESREDVAANDQPFFSEALYRSDVRFATLTTEYNCNYANLGYVQGKVRILHGQNPRKEDEVSPEEMADVINRDIEKRIYAGGGFRRVMAYPAPLSKWRYPGPSRWRYRLRLVREKLREEGIVETVRTVIRRATRLIPH
ncbi:MAG: hypothetical protein ABEI97_05285, partial [Candidatus Nanohaloarchaea archaeon]